MSDKDEKPRAMSSLERQKQLVETLDLMTNFVRVALVRRALQAANAEPHLTFWVVINNALLDTAVIDWCKLFGSDDEEHQPTHRKNVVTDEATFRDGLLTAVGVGGDVRLSPVKRVASAVGEGSMAIAFVHQYLADVAQSQRSRT